MKGIFFVLFYVTAVQSVIHLDDYYVSYPDTAIWREALRYCAHHGMQLIDLPKKSDGEKVWAAVRAANATEMAYFWTSGISSENYRQYEAYYYWGTTGEKVDFTIWTIWHHGTSLSVNTWYCLYSYHNNHVYVSPCTTAYYFVCSKKKQF